jgi:hypothetical protein
MFSTSFLQSESAYSGTDKLSEDSQHWPRPKNKTNNILSVAQGVSSSVPDPDPRIRTSD